MVDDDEDIDECIVAAKGFKGNTLGLQLSESSDSSKSPLSNARKIIQTVRAKSISSTTPCPQTIAKEPIPRQLPQFVVSTSEINFNNISQILKTILFQKQ